MSANKEKWERTEFENGVPFRAAIIEALNNLYDVKAKIRVKNGKRKFILLVRFTPGEF